MNSKTADNLKGMIDEILNVIRTIYEEGKSYSDAELQESLAVIIHDLKLLITLYPKQPISPIERPADGAFLRVYSSFSDHILGLLDNNILTKKHLEPEDLERINEALVKIDEDLTALRLEIERIEG